MKSIIFEIMNYDEDRSPESAKELLRIADIYLDERWISLDTHKRVCEYIRDQVSEE